MEKPYREAGGPTEGMVNMEANRGASPRGFRAVSPVCTLETPKSALWQMYYLKLKFILGCARACIVQAGLCKHADKRSKPRPYQLIYQHLTRRGVRTAVAVVVAAAVAPPPATPGGR